MASATMRRKKRRRTRGLAGVTIPPRGYCISRHGRHTYDACFPAGVGALARAARAAKTLAKKTGEPVDLVQVQAQGSDRFIIMEYDSTGRPRRGSV